MSPAVYPFVQAAYRYGPRKAPVLALLVHMAEGGGTVGYLSRQPARGVSVHFVCERSGRIVQMVDLEEVTGSLNPRLIRISDDPPFVGYNGEEIIYGATAAQAVLGDWWWRNPNPAVISIEVEGWARDHRLRTGTIIPAGPNLAQRRALVLWSRDMRARFPTLRGNLAHRDFAAYKACPGKFIPWSNMGGHGPYRP